MYNYKKKKKKHVRWRQEGIKYPRFLHNKAIKLFVQFQKFIRTQLEVVKENMVKFNIKTETHYLNEKRRSDLYL